MSRRNEGYCMPRSYWSSRSVAGWPYDALAGLVAHKRVDDVWVWRPVGPYEWPNGTVPRTWRRAGTVKHRTPLRMSGYPPTGPRPWDKLTDAEVILATEPKA